MGCDIHMFVEKLGYRYNAKTQNEDRVWEMMMHEDMAYDGRNYYLFSLLAGVRNYDEVLPIAEPKGFPGDVSKVVKDELDNVDIHSVSHLTVAELDKFNWDAGAVRNGILSAAGFATMLKEGAPDGWCRGIGGPGIRMVTESEMRDLLAQHPLPVDAKADPFGRVDGHPLDGVHCNASWKVTHRTQCSEFLEWLDVLKKQLRLPSSDKDAFVWNKPEEVRLVFGFDN